LKFSQQSQGGTQCCIQANLTHITYTAISNIRAKSAENSNTEIGGNQKKKVVLKTRVTTNIG